MQQRKTQSTRRTRSAARPGTCSLVMHILRGACTDGMQVPALLGVSLTTALYYERFPYHEAISALLIGSIVFIGLLRGCADWQQELGDYQRQLVTQRHQAQADQGSAIPGFIPFTRR